MPTLHLLCGKIASGKSTLGETLATRHAALLLSEDHWLSALYPGQITSVSDYVQHARRLRAVVGPLVTDLLSKGLEVVLDFPANRPEDRQWLGGLATAAGATALLHYLELDDALCLERLQARNGRGEHAFAATQAEFELITRHFQAPHADEGLQVRTHGSIGDSSALPRDA